MSAVARTRDSAGRRRKSNGDGVLTIPVWASACQFAFPEPARALGVEPLFMESFIAAMPARRVTRTAPNVRCLTQYGSAR